MVRLKPSSKHDYKLKNSTQKRHKALNNYIQYEKRKRNITKRNSAISKKKRLNVLRIYNKKYCDVLTRDMKYLNKTYGLRKTKNICKM